MEDEKKKDEKTNKQKTVIERTEAYNTDWILDLQYILPFEHSVIFMEHPGNQITLVSPRESNMTWPLLPFVNIISSP